MVIFAVDHFKELCVLVQGLGDGCFIEGKIGSNTLYHSCKGSPRRRGVEIAGVILAISARCL